MMMSIIILTIIIIIFIIMFYIHKIFLIISSLLGKGKVPFLPHGSTIVFPIENCERF